MEEKILCSAIWYKELNMNPSNPINIKEGIVFCGFRHHNCIHQMCSITGKRNCEVGENIQGFLTNKNRFVDRVEGGKIALQSNQIKELKWGNKLYSEDLY